MDKEEFELLKELIQTQPEPESSKWEGLAWIVFIICAAAVLITLLILSYLANPGQFA